MTILKTVIKFFHLTSTQTKIIWQTEIDNGIIKYQLVLKDVLKIMFCQVLELDEIKLSFST